MTDPSDPENKPPTRIPRPEDILARPAVVVGSGTRAKRFNATMVGVAPPASPLSPSRNAEGAPTASDGTEGQNLPKRPPPLRRPGGTMLGLSPPGVDPAAPRPPDEVTPGPALAYRDANLGSEPLPEPVSLEPSDVMASTMPFSRDDIPVAAVTRSEVPPAFVTADRPGSEPEIGSVDLALQSVAAVESRVSSSSDQLRAVQSEPPMISEAAWTQQPHFVPSHQGLDQTFNLAAPKQPNVTTGLESTPRDAQPAPGDWGQAASANAAAAGSAWRPPREAAVADTRAVFSATTPKGEAPSGPDSKPAPPPPSGFGLVMGLVFGIAVVSAAALGAVLVFAPEADLAQAVRDVLGMSRPGVKAPHTPAANVDATQPVTPASTPNDGVAAATGVPESDSRPDAVATALVADEAPSADGVASTEATSEAADAPLDEPLAGDTDDEAPDSEETPAAPSAPVEQGFDGVPDSVDQGRLVYLVRLAIRRAEKCHLGGRAVGTANVVLTFGPDGRVSDARVVGAPIEGAPVAACIEGRTRAVTVKPYEGGPFTYTTKITLR